MLCRAQSVRPRRLFPHTLLNSSVEDGYRNRDGLQSRSYFARLPRCHRGRLVTPSMRKHVAPMQPQDVSWARRSTTLARLAQIPFALVGRNHRKHERVCRRISLTALRSPFLGPCESDCYLLRCAGPPRVWSFAGCRPGKTDPDHRRDVQYQSTWQSHSASRSANQF